MEPAQVPLPLSRSSSRSSSSSRSGMTSLSASQSPGQRIEEWPFIDFGRGRSTSRSSSRSSSSWPFVTVRSRSASSAWSIRSWHYQPVPAKEWEGIYPPVLPPPDFFDLEEEEEFIEKEMFKKESIDNPLYDETGKVNLPVNDKGILILDPESRTRIIDANIEHYILKEYLDWLASATAENEELGAKKTVKWLDGLRKTLIEDFYVVWCEYAVVVDEERKKRGLSDWETHIAWYSRRFNMEDDAQSSKNNPSHPPSTTSQRLSAPDEQSLTHAGPSEPLANTAQEVDEHPFSAPTDTPPPQSSTASDRVPTPVAPPLDLFTFWA